MKRSFIFIFLAAVVLFLAVAPVAQAVDAIKIAVTSGAERLGCIQNADGGWDFDVTGLVSCPPGGPGPSPSNTFGVTAHGMLDAYSLTHDPDYKASAVETGDALKAQQLLHAACATPDDRPVTANVLFLLDLSKKAGSSYKTAAKNWFACITADFTGKTRADERLQRRIGQGNDNLGGWDVAFDVRTALTIGGTTMKAYALAELAQVFARQADWDKTAPAADTFWDVLSKAHLLLAMEPVRTANALIKAKVHEFTIDLLAAQFPDGSWGNGTTQTTAYAVLALDAYPQNSLTKAAVKAGVDFLLSQQLPNGGFDDGTGAENSEVNSEVLQALTAVH
jgi:hypothetical protein